MKSQIKFADAEHQLSNTAPGLMAYGLRTQHMFTISACFFNPEKIGLAIRMVLRFCL